MDNLTNPDGSVRWVVHNPPNRQNPPTHLQHYPPRQQHTSQSTHHHPHPPQVYNYSNPMPVPVITSRNHMSYQNITMQQSFQRQVSVDRYIPRGSYVAQVRVPAPVQTRSVIQYPPQRTRPPVQIPQPGPFPPSPMENIGAMVPVFASVQDEQNNKDEKEEEQETEQVPVNGHQAKIGHYMGLGQVVREALSSLEGLTEKVKTSNKADNELRATVEVLNCQLKELKQEIDSVRNNNEEIMKKSEEDVRQAKSEAASWRQQCIMLNDHHKTFKTESEEKDNNIRLLTEKVTDNETKITQQDVKVLNLEMSERKLKNKCEEKEKELECFSKRVVLEEIKFKEEEEKVRDLESSERKLKEKLDDKDKHIKMLERNHEKKCEQFIKMKEDFNNMTTTNKVLTITIRNFVKKEKADEIAKQELETNFKLRVQELEAKISEKSNENTKISEELEKERKDNQVDRENINEQIDDLYERVRVLQIGDSVNVQKLKFKVKELEETILERNSEFYKISQDLEEKKNDNELKVNELKEKSKLIKDLKDEFISIQKKNDELLYKFENILMPAKSSVSPENPKKQQEQTVSCSSSSSENETYTESSSSSITKDGYNKNVRKSRRNEVELLELQDSPKFSLNNKLGKRKHSPPIKSSAAKKQRQDDHNGRQNKLINFPEISHIHFNQESNTEEGGTEIPEMSITSRSTRSSMGRLQR